MISAVTRARKVGGSIVVTIPKEVVKEESIREGEPLVLHVEKIKKSGFGMLKGIGPFTKEDELDAHDI